MGAVLVTHFNLHENTQVQNTEMRNRLPKIMQHNLGTYVFIAPSPVSGGTLLTHLRLRGPSLFNLRQIYTFYTCFRSYQ